MKRRGFTLIELMVVIAIIIILAAIAIPNYLKMTERAKRSRVASDMSTLATVLETFKTDWGVYPTAAAAQDVSSTATVIYTELSGTAGAGTGVATVNIATRTNAVGEVGGIDYIKGGTLTSMTNPWGRATNMMYGSANGSKWVLYMDMDGTNYLTRTDAASTVATVGAVPAIP